MIQCGMRRVLNVHLECNQFGEYKRAGWDLSSSMVSGIVKCITLNGTV